MINRKKKGVKALAYTFVIFGAVCLTKVPMTNSKYIKESKINGEYLEYKAGFKQLSYVTDEYENINKKSITPVEIEGQQKVIITFDVPRNSIDTENGLDYIYYFDTKNKGCVINEPNPQSFQSYIGYDPEPIHVSMTCDAKVENSTDSLLSIEAVLENRISAETYVEVYEHVNDEESFLYRKYGGNVEGSKNEFPLDDRIVLTSTTKFTEYIQWLIRYLNYNQSLSKDDVNIIKLYLEDMIIQDFKNKDDTYQPSKLSQFINIYNQNGIIPNIEGINQSKDNKYIYSIDTNLLGYAKTYNANKDLPSDSSQFKFFFYGNTEEEINLIFNNYSKKYFGENASKINEYVAERGGVYKVLYSNGTIGGMSKQYNSVNQLNIDNLNTLILMANLEPNTYKSRPIKLQNLNLLIKIQLYDDFSAIRGIMEDNTEMKDLIITSPGNYSLESDEFYLYDYFTRGFHPEIEYENTRRYFIYRSTHDSKRFILVKIEPEGEASPDNCNMNMYFSYLDEAIEAGPDGIFTFDKEKDEIFINIDTPFSNGMDKDYVDVSNVIQMLNAYLTGTYPITPEKNIIKPKYSNYYYYNYKYEVDYNDKINQTNNAIDKSQDDEQNITNGIAEIEEKSKLDYNAELNDLNNSEEDTKDINTPNMDVSDIDKSDEKEDEGGNTENSKNMQEQPISEETAELTEMTELNKSELKTNYSSTYKLPESISTIEDINSSNHQEKIPNVNEISESKSSEVIVTSAPEESKVKIEDVESEKVIEDATITEDSISEVLSE